MEPGKELAIRILSGLGFHATEIDPAETRTADLQIADDATYQIEVKDKRECETQLVQRRAALNRGEAYTRSDSLDRSEGMRRLLRGSRQQLNATAKDGPAFQLIWLNGTGIDGDTFCTQARSTFYGIVPLTPKYPHHALPAKMCLYFDFNCAFDMRDIDGLILMAENKYVQLCVNEFATRTIEFRRSALYHAFAQRNGIFDPVLLAETGAYLACRFDLPRRDEDSTSQALREQTGVLYEPIRIERHIVDVASEGPESK